MQIRRGQARGTLFWLLCVLCVLILVLLIREFRTQALALEVARFELRLSQLRLGILVKNATLTASQEAHTAAQYEGVNAFAWLVLQPDDYLGEAALSDATLPERVWVYDPALELVAYKPSKAMRQWWHKKHPDVQESDTQWLQFRVRRLRSKYDSETPADYLALVPSSQSLNVDELAHAE